MDIQALKQEIKKVIIDSLNLEGYSAGDIADHEPLFGEGLGLDSIDALELGIAIKRNFNIELNVEDDIKDHFFSVDTLSTFIQSCQSE